MDRPEGHSLPTSVLACQCYFSWQQFSLYPTLRQSNLYITWVYAMLPNSTTNCPQEQGRVLSSFNRLDI